MALDTVLVAVGDDDDERLDALARTAIDIAGPAGATVALLHVFSEDQYRRVRGKLEFAPNDEVTPDIVARRHVTIRDMGGALEDAGIEYTSQGAVGEKGERVVSVAEQIGADLILVGGRKRSPAGKAVFGSTAQEVMLNAPCPVTFVRAD
jgi:Universal stress protein UspA and related nucleotide-binding proteins